MAWTGAIPIQAIQNRGPVMVDRRRALDPCTEGSIPSGSTGSCPRSSIGWSKRLLPVRFPVRARAGAHLSTYNMRT